jgi:hypothetical protein
MERQVWLDGNAWPGHEFHTAQVWTLKGRRSSHSNTLIQILIQIAFSRFLIACLAYAFKERCRASQEVADLAPLNL